MKIFNSLNGKLKTIDLSKTENKFYISDKNYKYEMVHRVRPFLEKYVKKGYFDTRDNLKIYYETYINFKANKAVVISHGMGECITKMEEVIYYFFKAGYSVFIMDHRGHGNSGREAEDITVVHIDNFEKYVLDLHEFIEKIVFKYYKDCYLYGHSMGGGIGAAFIEKYPFIFKKVVLTAPMIEMNTFVPKPILKAIIKIETINGKRKSSIFPKCIVKSVEDFQKLCSTCKIRASYYYSKVLLNKRCDTYGLSFDWLRASLDGTFKIQEKRNMDKVKSEVLIFQAENDYLVKGKPMRRFVNKVEGAKLIFVPGVKHELYNTYNDVMIPYFNTIFEFLERD